MEKIGLLCLVVANLLASFACGDKAESREFSSKRYYEEASASDDHIRFPDNDDMLPEDLEAEASVERVQGLKFYAVQNGNMPLIIYPVTSTGLTSSGADDQHGLESIIQQQATQPHSSAESDFEESLKNVAQGFIFPSSPATAHEEIFKQLLAAGSQGPASEPYVIPTPKKQIKQIQPVQPVQTVQPEAIISIPSIPQITHAYILEQPQIPVMAIINPNQHVEEPIYLSQHTGNDEGQPQQEASPHYSLDINTIPVESQYLQNKPSHYHMVGPHLFSSKPNEEPQKDQEHTSPYREEPSKIPLHPPPPIKASTYGPPQTVHASTSQPSRHYPSKHRPPSAPRPPPLHQTSTKGSGLHLKGPPKSRPHGSHYRLHSGPHHDHGHQHHHHHYHHESPPHHHRETSSHHHHKESHHSRPPPNHRPYMVHETKSPPHHSRPPPSHTSSHKHPYTFHNSPPKPSSGSHSRPPNHHSLPPSKPLFRPNLQKGTRPYGPPKTLPHGPPPASNSIGSSHPAITKAIFHPTHSPDLTVNQNAGPIKDLHGYTPGRYEYDSEASATAHTTPEYSTANHDSHRPPDASPSASISEPYVTSPPRPAYSDEEDEETSPKVEVYSPMNDNLYGADSYQRIKEAFKPPVIVYKGVRPPVRVYQKPETGPPYHYLPGAHMVRGTSSNHPSSYSYLPAIESTWVNHNTASTPYYHQQRVRGSYSVASPSASSKSSDPPTKNVAEEIHITTNAPFQYSPSSPSTGSSSSIESLSSSSDDSSSWTPINAPAGAVPARAYHIPPPDLSRGASSQPINHHNSYYGSANARADDEDLVLTEQNSQNNPSTAGSNLSSNSQPSGTGSSQLRRENNSEEVVSAVVLVKHR